MKKTMQTFRYLSKSFIAMAVIGFFSILGTALLGDLIYALTDSYDGVLTDHRVFVNLAPLEIPAGLFALLAGLLLYFTHFKVALANGVSRKTYWLANLPAAALTAGLLALFNQLFVPLHSLVWRMGLMLQTTYWRTGWFGLLVLQFALYLLLVVVGWFIVMAYYRASAAGRWAISLSPVALIWLFAITNASTHGGTYRAFAAYWRVTMGLAGRIPNPYVAALSLLVYAAAGCGLVYLLVRRAEIRG